MTGALGATIGAMAAAGATTGAAAASGSGSSGTAAGMPFDCSTGSTGNGSCAAFSMRGCRAGATLCGGRAGGVSVCTTGAASTATVTSISRIGAGAPGGCNSQAVNTARCKATAMATTATFSRVAGGEVKQGEMVCARLFIVHARLDSALKLTMIDFTADCCRALGSVKNKGAEGGAGDGNRTHGSSLGS